MKPATWHLRAATFESGPQGKQDNQEKLFADKYQTGEKVCILSFQENKIFYNSENHMFVEDVIIASVPVTKWA